MYDDPFFKRYLKGKIVKAKSGSLGLFTFDTKKHAKEFANDSMMIWLILKVKSIGRGRKPKKISTIYTEDNLNMFYANDTFRFTEKPPPGTICYPAVEVLT